MVTNKMVFGKAGTMTKGILLGTTAAWILTLVSAIIMTQLVLSGSMKHTALGYWAMVLVPLVSAISAFIAVGIIKRQRMQVCLLSGLAYFVTLLIVNLVFFGGQFDGIVITAILILSGVLCVGLLGLRGERRGAKKYKSYRPR